MDLRSRAGNGGNDGINNLLTTRRTNNEKPGNRIHTKHETALSFLRHRMSSLRSVLCFLSLQKFFGDHLPFFRHRNPLLFFLLFEKVRGSLQKRQRILYHSHHYVRYF